MASLPFSIARHPAPVEAAPLPDRSDILLRQLRHQTRNALQRVIAEITRDRELSATPHGRALAADLEARICRAAKISDQLFEAAAPEPIAARLRALGDGIISVLAASDQQITIDVSVQGTCPGALHDPVIWIAHEMIGNAIKHGMALLCEGRIEIRLETGADGATELQVRDNGWGLLQHAAAGEGCGLIQELASPLGGRFRLSRRNDWTEAVVSFPPSPSALRQRAGLATIVALAGLTLVGIAATERANHVWPASQGSACVGSSVLLFGTSCR